LGVGGVVGRFSGKLLAAAKVSSRDFLVIGKGVGHQRGCHDEQRKRIVSVFCSLLFPPCSLRCIVQIRPSGCGVHS
jgi:hypothetical protein